MSISRRCEDCSAWKPVQGYLGKCHALPPIAMITLHATAAVAAVAARWPQTRDGDW